MGIVISLLFGIFIIWLFFRNIEAARSARETRLRLLETEEKEREKQQFEKDKNFFINFTKKKEEQINNLCNIIRDLNNFDNYLDNNKKIQIIKKFKEINIPNSYSKFNELIDKKIFDQIKEIFNFKKEITDYLNIYNKNFIKNEQKKYKKFFSKIEKNPLTNEQQKAIVTEECNTLVVAGAGTGKTSTIVGKVAYLIKKELCLPDNILVLAYNKEASLELKKRIEGYLLNQHDLNIKTFHSFGYSAYEKANINKPSLSKLSENKLEFNKFIKNEIETLLLDKKFSNLIREYFTNYIKPYKSVFDFESKGEYFSYLKSQNITITLKGEQVKSFEECEIANYLFLNQINYEYEKSYSFDTSSPRYRQYKPDFFLTDYDVYIEHFAINRNGQAPNFFHNYEEQMVWKRQIHNQNETHLIETYSYEKSEGILLKNLEKKLKKLKVNINPLDDDQMLKKLNEKGKILDFSNLISTFLNHFKSNELTISNIKDIAYQKTQKDRYYAFIKIFENIYNKYQKLLSENNEIDFNDMIFNAKNLLINKIKKTSLTHVIIDEFQDISLSRFNLINSLSLLNPNIKYFCVGDDWQSIYRFNGSLVKIMSQFKNYFGYTQTETLTNSFRLTKSLAQSTNLFITKNPNQIKKDIISVKKNKDVGIVIYVESKEHIALKKILKDIQEKNGKNVLILGRYNRVINELKIRNIANTFNELNISFKTVHSSKGLENDYVIILDNNRGRLGFPSEMTDDPLLELVMGEEDNYLFAEERRLFYVALSRAKNKIYLSTTPHNQSIFIRELINNNYDIELHHQDEVGNIDCEDCKTGWMIRKSSVNGPFYGCSNFPLCRYTREICKECRKGIYIDEEGGAHCSNQDCLYEPVTCNYCYGILEERNILNGKYGEFYKCFSCGETQDIY